MLNNQQSLKVISLLEPWATLVAIGVKRIETRSWATSFRGEIFIHSCKAITRQQIKLMEQEPFRTLLRPEGAYAYPEINCGRIIARTEIKDCSEITAEIAESIRGTHEWTLGDYTPGRFAWILGTPQRLVHTVPVRGYQRLWNWQPEEYPIYIKA